MQLHAVSQRIGYTVTGPAPKLGTQDGGVYRCPTCGYWELAGQKPEAQKKCPKC